jgi:hypothetical protein
MDTKLAETSYTAVSNQTVRIKVPYRLRILCGNEIWNYDLPNASLPKVFRKRISGNWFLEKIQIEKDGTLTTLFPDQQGPASNPPQQPVGYPIRPK